MTKHENRKTFADIVAEVEATPAPKAPKDRPAGFTLDGTMIAPDGRAFTKAHDDISIDQASELLGGGALAVVDGCGCQGGCPLEWMSTDDRRRQITPVLPRSRKRVTLAFVEEWQSDDGSSLVYFGGDVTWPNAPDAPSRH